MNFFLFFSFPVTPFESESANTTFTCKKIVSDDSTKVIWEISISTLFSEALPDRQKGKRNEKNKMIFFVLKPDEGIKKGCLNASL